MDWIITRTMQRGRPAPPHMRVSMTARGRVVVEDQPLGDRGVTRLARVIGADVPVLHDVRVLPSSGSAWRIAGLEHLADGPLDQPAWMAQVWVMEPAPDQDLMDAELRVAALLRLLEQHGIKPPPAG